MTKRVVAAVLVFAAVSSASGASQVKIFRTESAEALLKGTLEDLSVDSDGVLALARRAEKVAAVEEPFAFSFAALPDGWAVGTGNDGKVLEVRRDGTVSVLFDAPEPVVFALWADPDGTLFAGTSPQGKVYRIANGKAEPFFDPGETYIWSIVRGADGALWVATGTEGRLYRVDAKGHGEVAFDSEETHLRSLLALPDGGLLIGTAPSGLVLRWNAKDKTARAVYDSALSEVVAFAPGPDGSAWAAVLSSESSFLGLAPKAQATGTKKDSGGDSSADDDGEPTPVVVVSAGDEDESAVVSGSRPAGTRGPRSELVRIRPDGRCETVWTSQDETLFSLASDGATLWAGTGLDGRLYRFEGDRARVEKDLEERQIVGLAPGPDGPAMLTTNAGAVWRFVSGAATTGTFTSAALDAGQAARFGVFRWSGEQPAGAGVTVSLRTGFSAEPDRTWSGWSAPAEGTEVALGSLPQGRYVQYRLVLRAGGGAGPRVTGTEISYRQENLRPRIERLEVLPPGQILVPAGFNPGEQTFEPAHPDREGIFTTLEPALPRDERLKTLWKIGWRTLRWKASDANGDDLEAALAVRPEGSSGDWIQMTDHLDKDHYGFDSTVLPDGRYRFRLTVSDAPGNDPASALETTEISDPVTIDHTPPVLRRVERSGRGARLTVYDAHSPLRTAEMSVDGAEWKPLAAADGMVDGRTEELIVPEIPDGAHLVLVRVGDAAFNQRTFDLAAELHK
jgi:hypothetical protein